VSFVTCYAQTDVRALNPLGVCIYPTKPTITIGGVSSTVTGSTISF